MSPTEALDEILWILHNEAEDRPKTPFRKLSEIHQIVKEHGYDEHMHIKDLYDILRKLKKDGYIDCRDHPAGTEFYAINFEGNLFITNGGYIQQEETKTRIESRAKLEKNILLYGALLAGIYSITQILDFFLSGECRLLFSIEIATAFVLFCAGLISGTIIFLIILEVLNQRKLSDAD